MKTIQMSVLISFILLLSSLCQAAELDGQLLHDKKNVKSWFSMICSPFSMISSAYADTDTAPKSRYSETHVLKGIRQSADDFYLDETGTLLISDALCAEIKNNNNVDIIEKFKEELKKVNERVVEKPVRMGGYNIEYDPDGNRVFFYMSDGK